MVWGGLYHLSRISGLIEDRGQGNIILEFAKRIQRLGEQIEGVKASGEKEPLTIKREDLEQGSKEQIQISSDYNEMLKAPNLDMISISRRLFMHQLPLQLRRQINMSTVKNQCR
ncbi:hypothetical protein CMK22_10340 [Candidatus Poribacteria bacterium]|nr:hypothetical protein [Candidatus Poribacteria bacterium]